MFAHDTRYVADARGADQAVAPLPTHCQSPTCERQVP